MNLIESNDTRDYSLRIWSNTNGFVGMNTIKSLVEDIASHSVTKLTIDVWYSRPEMYWTIRFVFITRLGKCGIQQVIHSEEIQNPNYLMYIASDIVRNINVHYRAIESRPSILSWEEISRSINNGEITIPRDNQFRGLITEATRRQRELEDAYRSQYEIIPGYHYSQHEVTFREPAKLLTLGDTTCIYNAKSPHLKCAVNPSCECSECPHYKKKEA